MQFNPHFGGNGFERRLIWLRRVTRNGWQNWMRNKILTAATVLVIALIFFVFNLVLALSYASDSVLHSIGKKADLRAEILPSVENYAIQAMMQELRDMDEVSEVFFISKEEALKNFGERYPNVLSFLDRNNLKNPLPNVLRIVARDVASNEAVLGKLESPAFSALISQEKLSNDTEQKSRNEKIVHITQFIKRVGFGLNLVFAIVAILILFNSISITIHSHRHEIRIMQLVGAQRSFIRGGYLFEGLLYTFTALLLSIVLSRLTLLYITHNLIGVVSNETLLSGLDSILLHFDDRFGVTFLWQFLGTTALGLLSSALAIELYLRKKISF